MLYTENRIIVVLKPSEFYSFVALPKRVLFNPFLRSIHGTSIGFTIVHG